MPVPVWDHSISYMMYEEPTQDSSTVLSEDIWKKFDLDPFSQPDTTYQSHRTQHSDLDSILSPISSSPPVTENFLEKANIFNHEFSEIRHHDCMWAGLCISKEHNRTLPAKKDRQIVRKAPVAATTGGRSLLIAKVAEQHHQQHIQQNQIQQQNQQTNNQQTQSQSQQQICQQKQQQQQQQQFSHSHQAQSQAKFQSQRTKNLESDGDSERPDTPQSSNDSDYESESDEEGFLFRHESISINEKLTEFAMPSAKSLQAVHVSEVSGQQIRKATAINQPAQFTKNFNDTFKFEDKAHLRNNNFMSDHCYHLNQPMFKRMDDLGVQTPSDSEDEEIDVVSYEKPPLRATMPASSIEQQRIHTQLTAVNAAQQLAPKPAPRPRGRPPSNATTRKRAAQQALPSNNAATTANGNGNAPAAAKLNSNSNADRLATTPAKRSRLSNNSCSNNNNSNQNSPQSSSNNYNSNNYHHHNHHQHTQKAQSKRNSNKFNGSSNHHHHQSPSSKSSSHHHHHHGSSSSNGSNKSNNGTPTKNGTTPRNSSDSEPDTERRSLHNNMERQRREDLKKFFDDLRRLVPDIQNNEKAPKVTILRQAVKYCQSLAETSRITDLALEEQKRRHKFLVARFKQLSRA